MASLNPELPAWFIAIVERLLEKEPARRFSSAKEVSELLEGCLAHVQQPVNVPLPKEVPQARAATSAARDGSWNWRRRWRAIITAMALIGFGGAARSCGQRQSLRTSQASGQATVGAQLS